MDFFQGRSSFHNKWATNIKMQRVGAKMLKVAIANYPPLILSVGLSRCAADCKKKAYYIDSLSGFLGDCCLDSKGLQA
jgi:hypothetical protein